MEITLKIPDQVYAADPKFVAYFDAMQKMVNRMAVSHFKYGGSLEQSRKRVDFLKCLRQRLSMYASIGLDQEELCNCGNPAHLGCFIGSFRERYAQDTHNTENLLDVANFAVMEFILPEFIDAFFEAQSAEQSPGAARKKS